MTKQSSMEARAAQLVSQSKTWTRGSRKSDGLAFVLFPSSKPKQAWYTRVDGGVCNCPGYLYRGACSHALAVRADYDQAREAAAQPTKVYENYYGNDDAF